MTQQGRTFHSHVVLTDLGNLEIIGNYVTGVNATLPVTLMYRYLQLPVSYLIPVPGNTETIQCYDCYR